MTILEVNQEAWKYHPGPLLLLAGPGTGKTHQLALRLRDLVETHGVDPGSITVITFTAEAAHNMRDRISDETRSDVYIPPRNRPRRVTTMHSLGLEIVRAHTDVVELPENFRVLTNQVLRRALFVDAALLAGSDESAGLEADELRQRGTLANAGGPADAILKQYETILRINGAIDYDDQIMLACRILRENMSARVDYAATAQHLLVDEYQDINAAQHELIALLCNQNPAGLFVVGDDDQSIYGFRGGSPRYIRDFVRDYGAQAQVFSLNVSRRCTDKVLGAAACMVKEFDRDRIIKPAFDFFVEKRSATHVKVHSVATDDQEARVIAAIARGALRRQQSTLILVPARQYADRIKRELRRVNVSYDHPVAIDDTGIARILEVYEWLEVPEDNFALRLCMYFLCETKAVSIPTGRARSAGAREDRQTALREIARLWTKVGRNAKTLWQALEEEARVTDGVLRRLHERLRELRSLREKGVDEFLAKMAKDFRPWSSQDTLTKELRAWRDELRARRPASAAETRVLTLQGAKGLEADVVCVVGVTEGILPRRDAAPDKIAESARLGYVSMTRAKQELHLFHARKRDASSTYLPDSFNLKPSRFLGVIDDKYVEQVYHQAPSKKRCKSA